MLQSRVVFFIGYTLGSASYLYAMNVMDRFGSYRLVISSVTPINTIAGGTTLNCYKISGTLDVTLWGFDDIGNVVSSKVTTVHLTF